MTIPNPHEIAEVLAEYLDALPDEDAAIAETCDDLGITEGDALAALAMLTASPAVTLTRPDYRATITEHPTGAVLRWTDYVANSWTETFPSLALALTRLATLDECADRDFIPTFLHSAAEHADRAQTFLDHELA